MTDDHSRLTGSPGRPGRSDRTAAGEFAVEVPNDATVHECGYCGRPFESDDHLALHRGLAHRDSLADAEHAAYEEAREKEAAAIRRFRLKALGAIILVYFILLMVYALV